MFFEDLGRFANNIALIDVNKNKSISYVELENQVQSRIEKIAGKDRKLVFIEAANSIETIVNYIACLRCNYVVYMLDKFTDEKTQTLIQLYQPNLLVSDDNIETFNEKIINLEPSLRLLLSTSGSTGSPKFVKLSAKNIHSNAHSICEYLNLSSADRSLCNLKLHYSFGVSILNSYLLAGASIILSTCQVNELEFSELINKHKATSFSGVPYTFETLDRMGFKIEDHPSLNCVTQAGGKLEASMVSKISDYYGKNGVRFYVMYGQTEASPRISYLPYDMAKEFPGSIGKSVPGGNLTVVDEEGGLVDTPMVNGELVYRGPNVMMGYAESPADLSSDNTPEFLLTGDIAYCDENGLFYITGRSKRFVKLFGMRVNLDEVQSTVKLSCPHSAVTGDDSKIVIALSHSSITTDELISSLAIKYSLPATVFKVIEFDDIPLMQTGKYDFKAILSYANKMSEPDSSVFSKTKHFILDSLGLIDNEYGSISELFSKLLSGYTFSTEDSFDDIGADSLSYVSLSIEIESMLGPYFSSEWSGISIVELEKLYQKNMLE